MNVCKNFQKLCFHNGWGWLGRIIPYISLKPCVKKTEFWGDALTMWEKNKSHCNISLLCICDIAPSFISPYFKLQIFGTDLQSNHSPLSLKDKDKRMELISQCYNSRTHYILCVNLCITSHKLKSTVHPEGFFSTQHTWKTFQCRG